MEESSNRFPFKCNSILARISQVVGNQKNNWKMSDEFVVFVIISPLGSVTLARVHMRSAPYLWKSLTLALRNEKEEGKTKEDKIKISIL